MKGRLFVATVISILWLSACTTTPVPPAVESGSAETPVAVKISSDGVVASEPAVARDAIGAVFVVYVEHSGKDANVYLQRMDTAGKPAGDKVRINSHREFTSWRSKSVARGPAHGRNSTRSCDLHWVDPQIR